ncbi:MAG: hypothetical protein RLN70_03455 [Rhodospirillaceae bacterium]
MEVLSATALIADSVSRFVMEECVSGPWRVGARDLYAAYTDWARSNNQYVGTPQAFGRLIGAQFTKTRHAGLIYYAGLRLKRNDDDCTAATSVRRHQHCTARPAA